MKVRLVLALTALGAVCWANDHNNAEAGRPLRFDDAYSIAYRERAVEFGLSLRTFQRTGSEYGAKTELKYGFAKNQDIGIAFEPVYSSSEKEFEAGRVEVGYFHGLRREIGDSPALAYRFDVGLPTGDETRGLDIRVRGIATKALGQYDKVHLNLDATFATDPEVGERQHTLGAIVGYSTPLGYPRSFDQTLVAEFALTESHKKDEGWTGSVGVGLRKQLDPRSVFDVGVISDVFSTKRTDRSPLRLNVGVAVSF